MTNICNFCSKFSNSCTPLDNSIREIFGIIFINVEIVIAECSLICEECVQKVYTAFDLRSVCIESCKLRLDESTELFLKANVNCEFSPNELRICRFCTGVVPETSFLSLENNEVDLRKIIKTHLPEVDLTITNNLIICDSCLKKLEKYKLFIDSWLGNYKLRKNGCVSNNTDISYSNHGVNLHPQHCDILNRDDAILRNEISAMEGFEAEGEGQIKIEPASKDNQSGNDAIYGSRDLQIDESEMKTENVQFETKIELTDAVLKEEQESFTYNVKDDSLDSFEDSDPRALLNNDNQVVKLESGVSEFGVVPETSTSSTLSSGFFTETVQKRLRMTRKAEQVSTEHPSSQPKVPRSSSYQVNKIDDGFICGLCPFQNDLETEAEVHFDTHPSHEYSHSQQLEAIEHDPSKHDKYFAGTLSRNSSTHHKVVDDNNLLTCEHCDYKTTFTSTFKRHNILHSNNSNLYQCTKCDFRTRRSDSCKRHQLLHRNPDEIELFKCSHCDFKTRFKRNLNIHEKLHFDVILFECQHCDFKTKYNRSLKQHTLLRHSDKPTFYQCGHCDYKTIMKCYLTKHSKKHSEKSEIVECEHCDIQSASKTGLRQHSIIHSGATFYQCKKCDVSTKYVKSYKQHQTHHQNPDVIEI